MRTIGLTDTTKLAGAFCNYAKEPIKAGECLLSSPLPESVVFSLQTNKMNIKIYRNIISPVALYVC